MRNFDFAGPRKLSSEHGESSEKFGRSAKVNAGLEVSWQQPWFIGCFIVVMVAFLFAIPQAKAALF